MLGEKRKILILVFGKYKPKLIQKYKNTFLKKNQRIVIIANQAIPDDEKVEIKTLQDYQDYFGIRYLDVLSDTHNLINLIKEARINSQGSFKEATLYQKVSLFEVDMPYILSELIPLLRDFCLSYKIFEYEHPSEIAILGKDSFNSHRFKKIFKIICDSKQVPLHLYKTMNFPCYSLVKTKISNLEFFLRKLWRFLKSIYFILLNYFNSWKDKNSIKAPVVFFNSVERKLDVILSVIKKYSPDGRLVINMLGSGCNKQLDEEKIAYKHFCGYKLYNFFNFRIHRYLKNLWETIAKDNCFQCQLNYRGFIIWDSLKDFFWHLIFRVFPENVYKVESLRKIILANKPKAIVVVDYCDEVILTAKALSTPTLSIFPDSANDARYFGVITSDYITATGNYWKDILLNLGAKPERVLVTGPTKFDLVINTRFYKGKILEELALDYNKKTIIYFGNYPSESMGLTYDDYLHEIRMVFRSLKNIKGINLITKLHPYDSNFSIYEKIAKEEGVKEITILHDFNKWKLLYVCDLVMTHSSTVSVEGILMNKIAILFYRTNRYVSYDMWNLESTKAALFINDFSELEQVVIQALCDSNTQIMLKENRSRYICDCAWPLDGMASQRVKDFIDRQIVKN